jgi:hypothetical protein
VSVPQARRRCNSLGPPSSVERDIRATLNTVVQIPIGLAVAHDGENGRA